MDPATRIDQIRACAEALGLLPFGEVNLILEQFVLPFDDEYFVNEYGHAEDEADLSDQSVSAYVVQMLRKNPGAYDDELNSLASYVIPGRIQHSADDEPWTDDALLRVFVSHRWEHRGVAMALKEYLALWGIEAFVAHHDIEVGAEWERTIMAGLNSCDAALALLHPGFEDSDWCDQEVGFVMGRGVPVATVLYGLMPYGALRMRQAITPRGDRTDLVGRDFVMFLLHDERSRLLMNEAAVAGLLNASSSGVVVGISRRLATEKTVLRQDQLDSLWRASTSDLWNSEARQNLSDLEELISRVPGTTPPEWDPNGTEPF